MFAVHITYTYQILWPPLQCNAHDQLSDAKL